MRKFNFLLFVFVVSIPTIFMLDFAIKHITQSTVYAPGYTLRKFDTVQPGMTAAQVEAILGPPIKRGSWGGFADVSFYSDQKTITDNFWRRWVIWKNNKVDSLMKDYWFD